MNFNARSVKSRPIRPEWELPEEGSSILYQKRLVLQVQGLFEPAGGNFVRITDDWFFRRNDCKLVNKSDVGRK